MLKFAVGSSRQSSHQARFSKPMALFLSMLRTRRIASLALFAGVGAALILGVPGAGFGQNEAAPGGGQQPAGPPAGGPGGFPGGGPGGFPGGGRGGFGGGRGGGFGEVWVFDLLGRDAVKTELNVTENQKSKLEALAKEYDEQRQALRSGFQGMRNPEEFQTRMEEMRKKQDELRKSADEKVRDVLTSAQFTRYRQIFLQSLGTAALSREDVADDLKLSDEQKSEMKTVQDDFRAKLQQMGFFGNPEERQKLTEERDVALRKVLTSAQQADWESRLGPKFDSAVSGAGPEARRAETAGQETPRRRNPGRRTTEENPTGTVVSDFTGKLPRATTAAESEADRVDTGTPNEPVLSFNFHFAPWEMVLKQFAKEANLTLDMSEVPQGTFNYYDDGKYSVSEALDIINGYLLRKGFVLVFRDRFLVVWNLDDPVPPNLVPQVSLEELETRGKNELLSVVFPLMGTDAKTAAEDIKELVGLQGKIVPLPKLNRLFVTDIGANLREIQRLLNGLGQIDAPKGNVVRSFKFKHISANDADRMIRDLFALPPRSYSNRSTASAAAPGRGTPAAQPQQGGFQPGGGWGGPGGGWGGPGGGGGGDWWRQRREGRGGEGGGGDNNQQQPAVQASAPSAATSRIQCSVDARTNSLLVTASGEDMVLVEKAIETIDVEEPPDARVAKGSNQPQLEVYQLKGADPRMVVDMLSVTVPGLVIYEDLKTRRISVFASPVEQEQVRSIIRQLDSGEGTVNVIALRKLDPVAAATSLRSLFGGSNADAPNIEADATGRRLMVRGTPDQVAEVRRVLEQLGEDGTGGGPRTGSGGPIRTIDTGSRSADELLSLIERLLPEEEKSVIRVIRPNRESDNSLFRSRTTPEPEPAGDRASDRLDRRAPMREGMRGAAEEGDTRRATQRTTRRESSERTSQTAAGSKRDVSAESVDDLAEELNTVLDEMEQEDAAPDAGRNPQGRSSASRRLPARAQTAISLTSTSDEAELNDEDAADEAEAGGGSAARGGEVRLSVVGGKLVMSSDDTQALDRLEGFVQSLVDSAPRKTRWTVYYLRTADATETATMLGALFPQGSVSQTTAPSSSLFGGFASGLRSMGGSLMDMSGLNSLGKGGPALTIVPEIRSNSLFISGPTEQVNDILQALEVLDSSELPESLKDRVPRMIPVEFADATEVSEIIKDVFKEQIDPTMGNPLAAATRGGGQGGFNPIAMMLGGGAQQGGRQQRGVQLTLGVDERTNTLVVSCNEQLFRQVEALVEALDESAQEANRTVRVVTLSNANTQVAGQALNSLLGKVKVNNNAARDNRSPGPQPPQGFGRGQGAFGGMTGGIPGVNFGAGGGGFPGFGAGGFQGGGGGQGFGRQGRGGGNGGGGFNPFGGGGGGTGGGGRGRRGN